MKIKNIFKLLAVAGTLALPVSCSDWLDVKMSDKIMENTLFSTNNGFMTALNGVYMGMVDVYGEDLSMGIIDVQAQYYNMVNGNHNYKVFANYLYDDEAFKNRSNSIWTKIYSLIANINGLLVHCDEENSALRENYYPLVKGEALALRAMLHFDLLRMYGPIYKDKPTARRIAYRTEFNKDAKAMQPSNVVIDSIIADLKKAETLLTGTDPLRFDFPISTVEENNMTGDRFLVYRHKRMNLYAVKALLARVFLYAGNYTEAARYAEEVIESKQFELSGNATDIQRSKEIIFSVYIDKFDQVVDNMMTVTSYTVENDVFNEIFDVANDGTNDFRVREGVSFENATSGKRMLKYKQENVWPSLQNTVVLIRLSEMYYILAECAETPEEASGYLNNVREVRGIDPVNCTAQNVQSEIEEEYRKEFYGEGQVFFYYKRLGRPTFVNCPLQNMSENNYMFSWPENEIVFGYTN